MRALVICAGGGIGDVLLATPVMAALRSRYDYVAALTAPAHRDVLADNPDLTAILLDDGSFASVRSRIARERFDAVVVTWATARHAMLAALAQIPVRVGQSRRAYSGLFTKRVTVRSECGDRQTHWTQILLDFARAIDCDVSDATPRFAVDNAAREEAGALLAAAEISGPYAVLHPTRGIAAARERWPRESLGALGRALSARFGVPLVISGTAEDAPIAGAIAQIAGATSLAAKTSIRSFAALAERARFVVAMDSGPMHLAAAVGAPTVGIFALASDEPDRWRPLGRSTAVVLPAYPCPPQHRKETCPDFACIRALEPGATLDAVARLIGGA